MGFSLIPRNRIKLFLEISILVLLSLYLIHVYSKRSAVNNGFDLSNSIIPGDEIFHGGPPRDGIPALTDPKIVSVKEVDWLGEDDRLLGIVIKGVPRAYPLKILNMHEIVNDTIVDVPVLITYCPLCFSGMAFNPVIDDKRHLFGVSGLLYNSDVLLYDRKTDSLWSQIMSRAISGKYAGRPLKSLPVENTTWQDWRGKYPDTEVLSRKTGYHRNYERDPYAGYRATPDTMFPVRFRAEGYHPKELVLGITIKQQSKAYHFSELSRSDATFKDTLAGKGIVVRFNREEQSGEILDSHCKPLPSTTLYWFAWYAFHPDTEIYKAEDINIQASSGSSC